MSAPIRTLTLRYFDGDRRFGISDGLTCSKPRVAIDTSRSRHERFFEGCDDAVVEFVEHDLAQTERAPETARPVVLFGSQPDTFYAAVRTHFFRQINGHQLLQ